MYDVTFTETALKQLNKLQKDVQARVIAALERIRLRPFHFVKRVVGERYFRLRVGVYRVILDIKKEKMIIMVVYVGHRKSVYKGI